MSTSIECVHMNHINAVVEGFDDSVAHFRDLYGAQFVLDLPQPAWHACLITIGTVMFELFAPHDFFLHTRFGPHYLGVEYQVPDFPATREAVEERGLRVA